MAAFVFYLRTTGEAVHEIAVIIMCYLKHGHHYIHWLVVLKLAWTTCDVIHGLQPAT